MGGGYSFEVDPSSFGCKDGWGGGSGGVYADGTASVCDEWIEHPALLTQRDTFANFFHDSEDFFNVFIAMAVLEWTPQQTQMLLTDLYPEGPFW